MNENKAASMSVIEKINEVSGFNPSLFAVDFTDLNNGEVHKRLPVVIQMAWFRLKYPEGKIAVQVTPGKDCFIATARIYPSYKDNSDCYLSEATASRGYCSEKPSVSPREWAQTAAVGIALRNAGFGLQFSMAGEELEETASNELGIDNNKIKPDSVNDDLKYTVENTIETELTPEEKLEQAMKITCPISKFKGKTLGEVLILDSHAIKWLATKYTGSDDIKAAAKTICEYSLQQTDE